MLIKKIKNRWDCNTILPIFVKYIKTIKMDDSKLANVFTINDQQYAITIESIIQIVRAVEVTMVPQAPPFIMGVIDYHGQIIPVMNIRYCLGIELKEVNVNDRFLILQTPKRVVAIVVDDIKDVITIDEVEKINTTSLSDKIDFGYLIRLESGIVFIYDIERLISPENEEEIKLMLESIK